MSTAWLRALITVLLLVGGPGISAAKAPLEFFDFDGHRVVLESVFPDDRWVVIMIWSHTCPICAREMTGQSRLHERHQDGQLSLLGMSIDGLSGLTEAWAFAEEREVVFPNVVAEPQIVARFFKEASGQKLQGTPTFMVYAPGRELVAVQVGPVPPEAIETFVLQRSH